MEEKTEEQEEDIDLKGEVKKRNREVGGECVYSGRWRKGSRKGGE